MEFSGTNKQEKMRKRRKKEEATNISNHQSIKTQKANLEIQLMTEGGVSAGYLLNCI